MAKRPSRRRTKQRAKAIRLRRDCWLRNSVEVRQWREEKLSEQGGVCAVSGVPLEDEYALDHCHKDGANHLTEDGKSNEGRCRGVLLPTVNCLEGKYLKLFKKFKLDTKYGLTFPEFLISLGEYLQQDYSENPLHFKYMSDYRDSLKRCRKDTLLKKLEKDFGIQLTEDELVANIIQVYMQQWVEMVEDGCDE